MLSIHQNSYHTYLSLNPFLSLAVCSLSAVKISHIFSRQIQALNLSKQHIQYVKRIFFIVLQLSATFSSLTYPTASAIFFGAACISSIAASLRIQKPVSVPLSFKKEQFSESSLPLSVIHQIISYTEYEENPVTRFKMLANVAKSNRMLYVAAQMERAKILNDHPEIPAIELFHSFEDIVHFAQTYNVTKLNLSKLQLNNEQIERLTSQLIDLTHLDLQDCQEINDESLQIISLRLQKLTYLNLFHCTNISTIGIQTLSSFKNLTDLNISACGGVNDTSLQVLAPNLKKLESLHLRISKDVTEIGIKALISFTNLTELDLADCLGVNDTSLQFITPHLKNLKKLNLHRTKNLHSSGIQALASLTHLTDLDLSFNTSVDDLSFQRIAPRLTQLTKLNISHCSNLSSEGIKTLAHFRNLTDLLMYGNTLVNDESLQVMMPALTNLKVLNMQDCASITFQGIQTLASLANLTTLDISRCFHLNRGSLQVILPSLKNLTFLNISYCNNFDLRDFSAIRSLKKLMTLKMSNCDGVNRRSLTEIIPHLKHLKELDIGNCKNVRMKSLETMSTHCPNLSYLSIWNCPKLQVPKVQLLFPKARIIF